MDPNKKNSLEEKKAYTAPEIILEVDLDTRAGSATGGDELPPGLNP